MKEILDQPGFISIGMGSEKLRNMIQTQWAKFNPTKLSLFALACMEGDYDVVKEAIESGTAPDLTTSQTPFQFGFITFTILGAQQTQPYLPDSTSRHSDIVSYLIVSGAPPDITDIFGYTALHHACMSPAALPEMAKLLLEKGANVNAQDRFGEVPIFFPFRSGDVALVGTLMEHGADLDIMEANGDYPRKACVFFGAEITAAVQRWERKRKGEVAHWEDKQCDNCKIKQSGLKQCSRCQVVRYCSTECQRAHWKMHKQSCTPFCAETTMTLKPSYDGALTSGTISRADFTRRMLGLMPATPPLRPGLTKNETENKRMVIKIQIPFEFRNNPPIDPSAPLSLFIYNKKRNFVCTVLRASDPDAYDTVAQVVQSRGVGGAKAYFAAELKNPDELVVKISEVLAEQPF
ncbi:ankyrin [Boletus edulis BED1]|uniref:Ankyrin n=1 Tax=Boletus edulis BED1 TaxID=1328754 RepID=A0AAD4GBB9_BOLED|nr:ankyrin [Boletus edulis BED1]